MSASSPFLTCSNCPTVPLVLFGFRFRLSCPLFRPLDCLRLDVITRGAVLLAGTGSYRSALCFSGYLRSALFCLLSLKICPLILVLPRISTDVLRNRWARVLGESPISRMVASAFQKNPLSGRLPLLVTEEPADPTVLQREGTTILRRHCAFLLRFRMSLSR